MHVDKACMTPCRFCLCWVRLEVAGLSLSMYASCRGLPGQFSKTYHTPSQGASLVKAHHLDVGDRFDFLRLKQVNLLTPQLLDASAQREHKNGGQPGGYCCYQDTDHPLDHFPWGVVGLACPVDVEAEDGNLEQQCKCTEAQQILQVCM